MYKCIRCDKEYTNKSDIERHINNVSLRCESKLKYQIFNFDEERILSLIKISDRLALLAPNNNNKNGEEYNCDYCLTKYSCKKYLTRHLKTCSLKNNYAYHKKLCQTYNDIKNGNINLIQIYDIVSLDNHYIDNNFTLDEKIGLVMRLDPNYVIEKLFSNKRNINILPINDFMSCIIINDEKTNQKIIKKINNNLLKDILSFKVKNYMENLIKYFLEFKIIPLSSYTFHNEQIKNIFLLSNMKSIIFEKVKYLLKRKNIDELNYFVNDINLKFESFEKLKEYYENIKIDFLDELFGFLDEELFDNFGNKIMYSTNGKLAIFDGLWEK